MIGGSGGAPDPFAMSRLLGVQAQTQKLAGRRYTLDGKSQVSKVLAGRTFVLIGLVSQSNQGNHLSGTYSTANASKVVNFCPDNGAFYAATEPLLGPTWDLPNIQSNYLMRLADKLIAANRCDNVVIVPVAVGGTTVQDWAPGGVAHHLIRATLARCKANGLFDYDQVLVLSHIGESDKIAGTSQADYVARASACYNEIKSFPGFSGKVFLTQTSFQGGATSSAVRAAQAALADNVNLYFLGDTDAFVGATYRDDLLHFNQVGANAITTEFASRISAVVA